MEKRERTLVTVGGKRYAITGETGRYYLCGNTQFRKSGAQIEKIEQPRRRKEPPREKEVEN